MCENIVKAKEEIIKRYSKYAPPSKDSVKAQEWLKTIPENTKPMVKDELFLQILTRFKVLLKSNFENDEIKTNGYECPTKYIEYGLLEVNEFFGLDNSNKTNITYSVKFTKKGIEVFMPIALKIIELKRMIDSIKKKKKF